MNIIKSKKLSESTITDITALSKSQKEEYPFGFDLSDPDCIYYLCYDNDSLVSALALFEIAENIYEAIAYTHSDFTNMGYFTALYNYLLDDLKPGAEISFACDKDFPPTARLIEKFSLKYSSTELMMSLELGEYRSQPVNNMEISADDFNNYKIFYNGKKIGSFIIEEMSGNNAYLFGFEILKKYRQKGLGKLSMSLALKHLKVSGIKRLYLQVSPENEPAYKIYKGLGFKINTEINYYKKTITSGL